jgi:uncharacterized protein YjbJ (UPF0337 family)
MQRRQDARRQNQQVAESLRERARGLIDPDPNAPPGGAGDTDAPPARSIAGADAPTNFEPVDASGPGTPDTGENARVVGEWFDPDRTEVPAGDRQAAAGQMRRAAGRARDAVENQQVPRRYRDLVQRVFDRVDRRADQIGGPSDPGSVAPQGKDASP